MELVRRKREELIGNLIADLMWANVPPRNAGELFAELMGMLR